MTENEIHNKEIEAKRSVLQELVKTLEKEIKELNDTSNLYTQEDAWINSAVQQRLINWKIFIEKKRKGLKYELK